MILAIYVYVGQRRKNDFFISTNFMHVISDAKIGKHGTKVFCISINIKIVIMAKLFLL